MPLQQLWPMKSWTPQHIWRCSVVPVIKMLPTELIGPLRKCIVLYHCFYFVYHISFKNIMINLLLNKVNPLACATVMTYSISGGFNIVAYQYITYIFNLFVHKKIIKLFETKQFISPCPCTTAALVVIPKTNLSKRCLVWNIFSCCELPLFSWQTIAV